jgi:hypothetical protein
MGDTNSESRHRERQLSLHTHIRDHDQPASQLREPLHRPRHVVVVDPTTTMLCASSAIVKGHRAALSAGAGSQSAGRGLDGLHHRHVAGAAAQIARERLADLFVVGIRPPAEQSVEGHEKARRAEAAL